MLVCPGCGGRNLPELNVCPFCHLRLGTQANGSRRSRPGRLAGILLATLLLALFASVVLIVIARAAPLTWV